MAPHHIGPDLVRRFMDAQRTEHLHLFVPDILGIQSGGRLHGHHRDHLEHMVLAHIPDGAGVVVITAPLLHPDGFA
ncbi:hypothetical protein D3C87_1880580 [compost metagenome]